MKLTVSEKFYAYPRIVIFKVRTEVQWIGMLTFNKQVRKEHKEIMQRVYNEYGRLGWMKKRLHSACSSIKLFHEFPTLAVFFLIRSQRVTELRRNELREALLNYHHRSYVHINEMLTKQS